MILRSVTLVYGILQLSYKSKDAYATHFHICPVDNAVLLVCRTWRCRQSESSAELVQADKNEIINQWIISLCGASFIINKQTTRNLCHQAPFLSLDPFIRRHIQSNFIINFNRARPVFFWF